MKEQTGIQKEKQDDPSEDQSQYSLNYWTKFVFDSPKTFILSFIYVDTVSDGEEF